MSHLAEGPDALSGPIHPLWMGWTTRAVWVSLMTPQSDLSLFLAPLGRPFPFHPHPHWSKSPPSVG